MRKGDALKFIWLIISQGASSLGNVVLAIFVARQAAVLDFAAFALVIPVYALAQRFFRVYTLIPRQIELNSPSEGIRLASRPPYSEAIAFGVLNTVPLLFLALVTPDSFQPWFLSLALLFPGLMTYDCFRNELLSKGAMSAAARVDALWLALQLLLSVGAALIFEPNVLLSVYAWGLPPLVIAIMVHFHLRRQGLAGHQFRSIRIGIRELWRRRKLAADGISDLASSLVAGQGIPYAVAALSTLNVVAGLRGGQVMLGPVNVLIMGLTPMLQMQAARASQDPRVARHLTLRYSAVFALLSLVLGCSLAFLPNTLGRQLLGPTWEYAAPLILGLAVHAAARGPLLAAFTVLRSLGAQRQLVRQRIVSSALQAIGAVLGASAQSPNLIGWGLALGALVALLCAYIELWRILNRRGKPKAS